MLDDPGCYACEHMLFSSDSRYLAWTPLPPRRGNTHGYRLWTPFTVQPRKWLPAPSTSLSDLGGAVLLAPISFDLRSAHIATAHWNLMDRPEDVVRIWDVATGVALAELPVGPHETLLTDVSFSPDGRSVLSASCGGETVSVRLDGPNSSILRACFSPDEKHFATASHGGTAQVWRAIDGSSAAVFSEHGAAVAHVAFSSGDLHQVVCARRLSTFTEHRSQ